MGEEFLVSLPAYLADLPFEVSEEVLKKIKSTVNFGELTEDYALELIQAFQQFPLRSEICQERACAILKDSTLNPAQAIGRATTWLCRAGDQRKLLKFMVGATQAQAGSPDFLAVIETIIESCKGPVGCEDRDFT